MKRTHVTLLAGGAVVVAIAGYAIWRAPADAAKDPASSTDAAAAATSASSAAETPAAETTAAALTASASAMPIEAGDRTTTSAAADADGGKDAHTVTIGDADADTTVDLARGQKLVVSLRANLTTGHDWAVVKAPPALGKPDRTFVAGSGVGAGGRRVLTFTPKDLPAGEHSVELGYARDFEPGTKPLRTFRFKLRAGT